MAIPTTRFVREAYVNRYDRFNYNGSYAINNDDVCYRDPTTGYVYPAAHITTSNYSSLASAYLLRRYAAKYFVGMAGAAKLATDLADLNFPVASAGVLDMVCASATFNIGDMVAMDVNGGVTAVLSDTVIATKDPDLAVGVVVAEYPSATTLVRCLMKAPLDNFGSSGLRIGKLSETWAYNAAGMGSVTGAGPFTQPYTFTQKLPAGALVVGYRANVTTAFAGTSITAVTLQVGWTGHLAAFSADATQSAFSAQELASLATAAGPQVNAETAPIVTFTLTGGNTLNAGVISLSVLYIAPEGP